MTVSLRVELNPDRGEHRQDAGAVAPNVVRGQL
jgi:hypothetical protein